MVIFHSYVATFTRPGRSGLLWIKSPLQLLKLTVSPASRQVVSQLPQLWARCTVLGILEHFGPLQRSWALSRKPWGTNITCFNIPIGSMVLLYMVTWIPSISSIYPLYVSSHIPAPWIRHGIICASWSTHGTLRQSNVASWEIPELKVSGHCPAAVLEKTGGYVYGLWSSHPVGILTMDLCFFWWIDDHPPRKTI